MLVASKQVVGTIQGILIFSNKYSCLLFSRNKQRIREEQRVRSRKLVVMPFVRIFTATHSVFTTRHCEKLQKEKHQEDISDSHSCVCAHCGRCFAGEEEIGYSNTSSVDTDNLAESEDNS